jgi:hypothetical protein
VVGEVCGCIEDRPKTHVYKMGGLHNISEVTILSHGLRREAIREVVVHTTKTWKRGARNTSKFRMKTIKLGISLKELGMAVKHLGGLFKCI